MSKTRDYVFKCKVNGNTEKKVTVASDSYYDAEQRCKDYLSENFKTSEILSCEWTP